LIGLVRLWIGAGDEGRSGHTLDHHSTIGFKSLSSNQLDRVDARAGPKGRM
jgi:hypothetical protein